MWLHAVRDNCGLGRTLPRIARRSRCDSNTTSSPPSRPTVCGKPVQSWTGRRQTSGLQRWRMAQGECMQPRRPLRATSRERGPSPLSFDDTAPACGHITNIADDSTRAVSARVCRCAKVLDKYDTYSIPIAERLPAWAVIVDLLHQCRRGQRRRVPDKERRGVTTCKT